MAPRELVEIVGGKCDNDYFYITRDEAFEGAPTTSEDGGSAGEDSSGSEDFQETNTQEEGVGEPDIVVAVGDVAYVASATRNGDDCAYRLSAVLDDQEAGLVAMGSVPLATLVTTPLEMLVYGDVLLLIGTTSLRYLDDDVSQEARSLWWWPEYETAVTLLWFDVSDPSRLTLVRRQVREGRYVDARLVDGTAYVVATRSESWGWEPRASVPYFRDEVFFASQNASTFASDGSDFIFENPEEWAASRGPTVPSTDCDRVGYAWPRVSELGQFTFVLAASLKSVEEAALSETAVETMATRADSTVYASRRNLYLTQVDYVEWLEDDEWPTKYRTVLLRLALNGSASFEASYAVPGLILNQFSLSETSDGRYLRVATTTRPADGSWANTSNAVFVYDVDSGDRVGQATGLAPGESIFSARFVGDDRCYLVTFLQTDPLFVIAFVDGTTPVVLAELKIDGFSSYLHPLNQTHLLGLGRDVALVNNSWGVAVLEQGLQLRLFDVSDDQDPRVVSTLVVGDRGTYSEALNDHKAFQLYDDDVFAFPASVADKAARLALDADDADNPWLSGLEVFQGALLFDIDRDGIIAPLANVSHLPDDFLAPTYVQWGDDYSDGYWQTWFDTEGSGYHIKRTLGRGDFLFAFSDNVVTKSTRDADSTLLGRVDLNDPLLLANLSWAIARDDFIET